jgi:dimethylglycine dehydrogenase
VGLTLANWMTEGDPGYDIWGMDVARFGDYATLGYTNAKAQENYRRRFRITFPNEELPAGRPLHTTPIYDRLTDHNAVWGVGFGLEHPLWFQRPGWSRSRTSPSAGRTRSTSSPRSAGRSARRWD